MEPLPDLARLSDEELKRLIAEWSDQEKEVSYRRRLMHGKIDIARAELIRRIQPPGGEASGTREPRRPRPTAPSAAAADLPDP